MNIDLLRPESIKADNGRHNWVASVALIISVSLLVCSPVFFWMLLGSAERDKSTSITILENRIIQCDNNAMLRRQLGINEAHPICLEPHEVPHR